MSETMSSCLRVISQGKRDGRGEKTDASSKRPSWESSQSSIRPRILESHPSPVGHRSMWLSDGQAI